MLLPQQIQAILYHFMMGWFYGCTFAFLCSFTISLRPAFLKGILEVLYHIVFTLCLFYGLYQINGGVTNLYLVFTFVLGVCVFYRWYLIVCNEFYLWFRSLFKPLRKKLAIVKSRILGIIIVSRKRLRRRTEHGKRFKKKQSQETTN